MRTFIHYDEAGEIISVVQTDSLPEGVEQPFYLENEKHGALEVTGDAEVGGLAGGDISAGFKVDVAKRRLVGRSAAKGRAKQSAAKKGSAKKVGAKKAAAKKGGRATGAK